jgi:hypothetical protein
LGAIFQNDTAMSKYFYLFKQIGMLRDVIHDAVRQFCATMIRRMRNCATGSMAYSIFGVIAGRSGRGAATAEK